MIRLLHNADQIRKEIAEIFAWADRVDVVVWSLEAGLEDLLWKHRERLRSLIVGIEPCGICDLYSGARKSRLEREHWPGNFIVGANQTDVRAVMGSWGHQGIEQASAIQGHSQDVDILEIGQKIAKHREESRVAAGSPPSGEFRTVAGPVELLGLDELRQLLSAESYLTPFSWLQKDLRLAGRAERVRMPGMGITEVVVTVGGNLTCAWMANGPGCWLGYFSSKDPQGNEWTPTCALKLGPQDDCDLTFGIESGRNFLLFRGRGGRVQDFGKLASMQTTSLITSNDARPMRAVIVAELGRGDLVRRLADFVIQWERDNPRPSLFDPHQQYCASETPKPPENTELLGVHRTESDSQEALHKPAELQLEQDLLIFTNSGRMIHVGVGISKFLQSGERVIGSAPAIQGSNGCWLVTCTRRGLVKRCDTSVHLKLGESLNLLSLSAGDELTGVCFIGRALRVVLVSRLGRAIQFIDHDLPACDLTAPGVKGIDLAEGDSVVAVTSWRTPEPGKEPGKLMVVSQLAGCCETQN